MDDRPTLLSLVRPQKALFPCSQIKACCRNLPAQAAREVRSPSPEVAAAASLTRAYLRTAVHTYLMAMKPPASTAADCHSQGGSIPSGHTLPAFAGVDGGTVGRSLRAYVSLKSRSHRGVSVVCLQSQDLGRTGPIQGDHVWLLVFRRS